MFSHQIPKKSDSFSIKRLFFITQSFINEIFCFVPVTTCFRSGVYSLETGFPISQSMLVCLIGGRVMISSRGDGKIAVNHQTRVELTAGSWRVSTGWRMWFQDWVVCEFVKVYFSSSGLVLLKHSRRIKRVTGPRSFRVKITWRYTQQVL